MNDQGTQDTEWLSITDAARAYGVAEKTVRRRIHAGKLRAEQITGVNGPEWRIAAPGQTYVYPTQDVRRYPPLDNDQGVQGAHIDPQSVPTGTSGTPTDRRDMVPLDRLEQLLAPVVTERDQLRAQVDSLQEQWRADSSSKSEEIGRLREMLKAAQGEAERLRATDKTPVPSEPSPTITAPTRHRRRLRWPWAR